MAERRKRGAADRDRVALDQIAELLRQPLNCTRAELAEQDARTVLRISEIVEATGRP